MDYTAPNTPEELRRFLQAELRLDMCSAPMIPGNSGPFAYLCHSFFEAREPSAVEEPRDCVVWANRGGGKTFMGAVATLLDLVFKPGIEIRVLAGSANQGARMLEYLQAFFDPVTSPTLARELRGKITARQIRLRNGSSVKILAQSHTSVRGTRVQVLRCDEADLFKPDIWQAAQFVTRSKQCGPFYVAGRVEALSTMQNPHGVMASIIAATAKGSRKLLKWGVLDVLESCPDSRQCPACPLNDECQGRAKLTPPPGGHFTISDAVSQKSRSSPGDWAAEMLCIKPRRTAAVLADFDRAVHVAPSPPPAVGTALVCGMDFGIRGSGVILWAYLDKKGSIHVVDEAIASGLTIHQQAEMILSGHAADDHPPWPVPQWIGVDPAGNNQDHHGKTCVATLRDRGLHVRFSRGALQEGLEAIRARLRPADGSPPRLFVHPRCVQLIDAMTCYHYPADKPNSIVPVKDGYDHPIDALRYMIRCIEAAAHTGRLKYTG